jgi:hypothetical protein
MLDFFLYFPRKLRPKRIHQIDPREVTDDAGIDGLADLAQAALVKVGHNFLMHFVFFFYNNVCFLLERNFKPFII